MKLPNAGSESCPGVESGPGGGAGETGATSSSVGSSAGRVRRAKAAGSARLAVENTHERQVISSPRKRASPRPTTTQVCAMTSWFTSPAMTCRYRFKVGLMSHHRQANADSSPLCARSRMLPKSLPITIRSIGRDQPTPQPIGRLVSRSTPSTNRTATSTDRSADARGRNRALGGSAIRRTGS